MDLFGTRTLPFLARRNYYYEFKHILPWGVVTGLAEGQFAGVVVARTFEGGPHLIAIASATPVAAFLSSLFWGMLCVGRPKIRLMLFFAAGVTLLTGTIGAIPVSSVGAVWFIAQMAATQVLLAGTVTTRSALWKSNYPRSDRARITARLQVGRFVMGIITVLVGASICNRDPEAYRFIFPAAALFGAISIVMLSKIHVRGERSELRRHTQPASAEPVPKSGLAEPFTLTVLLSPRHALKRMVRVLRNDHRFAQYLLAQAFVGVANLMTIPVAVAVVTQRLNLGMAWGFWISTGLVVAIPETCRLSSLHRWARHFDRVGVIQFRVLNVSCWVVSMLFGLFGTFVAARGEQIGPAFLPIAVTLFALRGLMSGLGHGGGSLAWNIGHLHFAKTDEAEIYMGIHVFLTGLRGLLAPLLGMWLLQTVGWVVWLIALILSFFSVLMYIAMAKSERQASTETSSMA